MILNPHQQQFCKSVIASNLKFDDDLYKDSPLKEKMINESEWELSSIEEILSASRIEISFKLKEGDIFATLVYIGDSIKMFQDDFFVEER